jgi:multimeric flavodoxin WrbA
LPSAHSLIEDIMVQVVGIAGSPRRRGNTELLLDQFLAGADSAGAETSKIVLARLNLAGCIACDGCWKDGTCVVLDDFQAVDGQLVSADVIVMAAPLFFWALPAQAKALVDRTQSHWARKHRLKLPLAPSAAGRERRRGIYIGVGGEPKGRFSCSKRTLKGFFLLYEADYWAELLFEHVDAKGKISDHPTALQDAFKLGVDAVSWD